jgi:ubiquinone/menaquinone biosynthesis C-methylase UbiE
MSANKEEFIPALGRKWLTPLYDPLLKWVMREEIFKRQLIEQAQIHPGDRVLDLGCGTGTLTLMIKQVHPQAEVTGLDADREVLALARQKTVRAGVQISIDEGLAGDMPYKEKSFDKVISSLMVHHLTTENKRRTFLEIFRILKPVGEFHLLDFGEPHSPWMQMIATVMRNLEEAADNFAGRIPVLLRESGLIQVEETGTHSSIFGPLSRYRGTRPGED